MSKHKQMQSVISSNLRLLVLFREALRSAGTAEENPLLKAVVTQANLCGIVLPNSLRVSNAELKALREGNGLIMAEKPAPAPSLPPILPGAGGTMILGPQHFNTPHTPVKK